MSELYRVLSRSLCGLEDTETRLQDLVNENPIANDLYIATAVGFINEAIKVIEEYLDEEVDG